MWTEVTARLAADRASIDALASGAAVVDARLEQGRRAVAPRKGRSDLPG